MRFLHGLSATDRGKAVWRSCGDRTEIVQSSYSLRSLRLEIVPGPCGLRTETARRGTVTVRSSCSLGIRVPKIYNFTFLLVLSVKMALKSKGGKGKRYKKVNVYLSQGGRTVMVRSLWDCRKITALYSFDFIGIARALCDNIAMGAARLPQDPTIIVRCLLDPNDHLKSCIARTISVRPLCGARTRIVRCYLQLIFGLRAYDLKKNKKTVKVRS